MNDQGGWPRPPPAAAPCCAGPPKAGSPPPRRPSRRRRRCNHRSASRLCSRGSGGRISAIAPGARCARITAPTATPGLFHARLARSKAYRWGEDGIAGICDRYQILCFRPGLLERPRSDPQGAALRPDPSEGNHGEDVKEYYFYLDSTPTHSYMKYALQVSAGEYPYAGWSRKTAAAAAAAPNSSCSTPASSTTTAISTSSSNTPRRRRRTSASASKRSIAARRRRRCTCCRSSGSATPGPGASRARGAEHRPRSPRAGGLCQRDRRRSRRRRPLANLAVQPTSSGVPLWRRRRPSPCSPTTNQRARSRFMVQARNGRKYVKDAFPPPHRQRRGPVNPEQGHQGVPALQAARAGRRQSTVMRLRSDQRRDEATRSPTSTRSSPSVAEADEFYADHPSARKGHRRRAMIQRQAFAGLMWSKQIYLFDVDRWLDGDNPDEPAAGIAQRHPQQALAASQLDARAVDAGQVGISLVRRLGPGVSHASPSRCRPGFRQGTALVLLFEQFQHPNGQIPAYEWEFSDLNPPVHAWAVWRVYNMDRIRIGKADRDVSRTLLPQAADQLRLVDQQGRQRRQQHLRRRLPRARQHHGVDRSEKLPGGACSSSPTPPAGWACSA
jgi:hypothetical protein